MLMPFKVFPYSFSEYLSITLNMVFSLSDRYKVEV